MPSLHVSRIGDEYRVLADGNTSLRFRSLTPHHDGPTAILEALDLSLGGRPHVDRLALLSSRGRASLAKALSARWDGHAWGAILDDACQAVYEALSAGEPAVDLEEEAPRIDDCLVEGLIPLDQITVLYADGGSLKSYFALALGIAALRNEPLAPAARWCVRKCSRVLYLDWETDKRTHQTRLYRLRRGLGLDEPVKGVSYLNLRGRPLHTAIQSVAGEVDRLGAELTILDSLGMACGDEPETAQANLRTLGALSGLSGTKLVLAHVNAATATSPNGPGRPYGSVFIRNTARSAVEARSEPDGEAGQLVTYHHRKANDGPLMPAGAIRYAFGQDGSVVLYAADPDLQHATIGDQISGALRHGKKSAATLCEVLGISRGTVSKELSRMQKRGIVQQLAADNTGRGKESLWGLADTKRGTYGD